MSWALEAQEYVRQGATRRVTLSEEAINDADKLLTISDIATLLGSSVSRFEIDTVRVEYAATASLGDRDFVLQLRDSGPDVIREVQASLAISPGATKTLEFGVFTPAGTGSVVNREALPERFCLSADQSLRFFDQAAVAPTADDVAVHVSGTAY